MVGHGRESPVEALVQGRQQEHVSLPQWDLQVGSVGCPGGPSLSQTVLELVLFPELYAAPSDGDC